MPQAERAPLDLSHEGTELRLTERHALADVQAVLRLCDSGRLRCSATTRRPTAASVAVVAGALSGGDFYPGEAIAAYAWPLLVQAGGLAQIAEGRLRLTPRGRSALGRPAADVIKELWQGWISKAVIDELSRVEHIKGQRSANALSAAKPRRQCVAAVLATCPPGEWVRIPDLFATMRRRGLSPTVARNGRALWKLYLVEARYGSLGYDGYGGWEILEGRYTLTVLFEYAATLGLLDVSYDEPAGARDDFRYNSSGEDLDYLSRYDGLRAVRLTGLGAHAVGLTDAYRPGPGAEPAQAQSLKALPNLDVVVTGEVDPADRLTLDAYAEQTSERVWTVSMASLLAALAAGRPVDHLRDFLSSRVAQPALPSSLLVLLDDVTVRAGQLQDRGHVRLIECVDPALAALVHHDRRAGALCTVIGDRHLAVPADNEAAFRRAVLALGYVVPA